MQNLLFDILFTFLSSGIGLCSLIYAGYLKLFKKIPYSIDKTIKPEFKDQFLKNEMIFHIMYYIVFQSLAIFVIHTTYSQIIIGVSHIILLIIIALLRSYSRKGMF